MYTKNLLLGIVLALTLSTFASQLHAATDVPSTATSTPGMVVGSNIVALVESNGKTYDVFPDTKNASGDNLNRPEKTIYFLRPTLTVDHDEDGLPSIVAKEFSRSTRTVLNVVEYSVTTRVGLKFHLRDGELMAKAAARLDEVLKKEAAGYRFTSAQFMTIPVSQLSVSFPDLTPNSACKLNNPQIPVGNTESAITVWFDCTDRSTKGYPTDAKSVGELRSNLPFMNILFTLSYNARQAELNVATVKRASIRDTGLYAKLSGDEKRSEVLISRNEYKKLLELYANNVIAVVYGGNQATEKFVNDALALAAEETIEAKGFNEDVRKQMFNPQDISPDEINKKLEDEQDKSSDQENVSGSTGGGVNIMGVLGANGNLSGSRAKTWSKDRHVRIEFEGKKWVAKSVDVLRVNLGQLEDTFTRSYTHYEYKDPSVMPIEGRQMHLEVAVKRGQ